MKHIFSILTVFLCCTLTLILLPTDAEAMIYEDTVRLHILANSDSDADQQIKLQIRDDILLTYKDVLGNVQSLESFGDYREEIETFVNARLSAYGVSYGAYVTFCEEWYDTREYESFTLPCGTYLSLVVHLGAGEGNNYIIRMKYSY